MDQHAIIPRKRLASIIERAKSDLDRIEVRLKKLQRGENSHHADVQITIPADFCLPEDCPLFNICPQSKNCPICPDEPKPEAPDSWEILPTNHWRAVENSN